MLTEQAAKHIQHMQKALNQMNVQLHHVISDITGETGMRIIRAIVKGEHNPKLLASYRDYRCKNKTEIIEKALSGHYREDHVFSLKQALELYEFYREKIQACDIEIEAHMLSFESQGEVAEEELKKTIERKNTSKNAPLFNAQAHLIRITGVDLTAIPGIEASTALKIISEIGLDMTCWNHGKQFASWLGLSPGNKVSGGKNLSGRTKKLPIMLRQL
jgi:transposase